MKFVALFVGALAAVAAVSTYVFAQDAPAQTGPMAPVLIDWCFDDEGRRDVAAAAAPVWLATNGAHPGSPAESRQ